MMKDEHWSTPTTRHSTSQPADPVLNDLRQQHAKATQYCRLVLIHKP